jgi:hypothetical protein
MWVENENGKRVDPDSHLDTPFSGDNDRVDPEDRDDPADLEDEKHYVFDFEGRLIGGEGDSVSKSSQGIVLRTKDYSQYQQETGDGDLRPLSKGMEDEEGTAGDPNTDATRVGVVLEGDQIHLLVERPGGTAGIGIIQKHVENKLSEDTDNYRVRRRAKPKRFEDSELERLMNAELDNIIMSFKNNPSSYDDTPLNVDSSLERTPPENYRAKYEIKIERGNTTGQQVREILGNKLGLDPTNAENEIIQEEVLDVFYKLAIKGLDDDGEIEINFTNGKREEKVPEMGSEFLSDELGERLIELIREQLD